MGVALLLQELVREKDRAHVARQFAVDNSAVVNVQEQGTQWSMRLSSFCERAGGNLALLGCCLKQVALRLQHGAGMDVVESQLLALPGMQVPHARQLIRAGFTSIHALAEAPADGRMVANKVKSLSVQQAKVLLQAARRERTR